MLPFSPSLSIAQVNQYLDDLALSHVKKDRPGGKKAIQMMLRNTSASEQKWLIRIIMKVHVTCLIIIVLEKVKDDKMITIIVTFRY